MAQLLHLLHELVVLAQLFVEFGLHGVRVVLGDLGLALERDDILDLDLVLEDVERLLLQRAEGVGLDVDLVVGDPSLWSSYHFL